MASRARLVLAILLIVVGTAAYAHDENTSLTLEEATNHFQQDRFGLFIHWGLYSVLSDGERVMEDRKIPAASYERLAQAFHPADFNVKDWVSLAKAAGMKYITFTAKHHDGFAMWDSGVSDYNIVRRTPFARDVVKELTDECHLQNIRLYLYYSQLDWHHPDYFPRGSTGKTAGRPEEGDWGNYLNYMNAQLVELLMDYDPIAGIWLDGSWDRPEADWQLGRTFRIMRSVAPAALIGSNPHGRSFPAEGFQLHGRNTPVENRSALPPTSPGDQQPRQVFQSMNSSWGYRITDREWKSTRDLVGSLVRAAGSDANLLLNVSAMPNGQIDQQCAQRLREIGIWMARNGETIYGTRGGPVPPQPWGATTHRGRTIYVHILDSEVTSVSLQLPGRKVRAAQTYGDDADIPYVENSGAVAFRLPKLETGQLHRIILLQTDETSAPPLQSTLETSYNVKADVSETSTRSRGKQE